MALSNFGWKDKANLKVKTLNKNELIMLNIIRASTRKLDLLLCENIFEVVSPKILNQIDATTKIIVTNNIDLEGYTCLLFGLSDN